jgi:hypothetical protein
MKRIILSLAVLFLSFYINAEEYELVGKQLIMGWYFEAQDTYSQSNIAIDAILKYAEAAEYQMNSYERYAPSCQIELYRERILHDGNEDAGVFIYINNKSEDYHDRYIEINFYVHENAVIDFAIRERARVRYKLVFFYNGYNFWDSGEERYSWYLVSKDKAARDFFISEIKKMKN